MDQEIRNRLRNVVTQCRKLLEDSVSQELEGKYVIFAKKDQVTADPNAPMSHLSEEEKSARNDILDHLNHVQTRGFKPKDALDQLIREIAFTHLNRLCAYKMMEAREVYIGGLKFREAVSRGVNSNGVKFYLADHPEDERLFKTGHQDVAYRHFLDWLGGLLSEEIGVLFNPDDPANKLYPHQTTLDEVLNLLNTGDIKPEEAELRMAWPTIWSQDETIGWVYQYFTPKEMRERARSESRAPRNSNELAFRNQFFTPRYVVEYLTDNTLGRIWYEMQKGNTKLTHSCRFLVHRPEEFCQEEAVHARSSEPHEAPPGSADVVPGHRKKRDPRTLKILDPACGSGHFLLYCFDLLVTIYEESYSDPVLGAALASEYASLQDLRRDIPKLILAHNLHGIDIDLRASQIAALALWLRCQRAYQDMGLKKERPKIARSNIVCAEPMPGETKLLREFVSLLEPKVLGQLVEAVFHELALAGEAGSLLRAAEEIRDVVIRAKEQWIRETAHAVDRKGQPLLFTQAALDRLSGPPQQESFFDLSDITDEQFFEEAETHVVEALRRYAETAQRGERLQRRLFADDGVRGFAFVDLCRKRFDVVLMNPPFGMPAKQTKEYVESRFPDSKGDILAHFVERSLQLCNPEGTVGVISSRSCFFVGLLTNFRQHVLRERSKLVCMADFGEGVLDATVETAAYILDKRLDSGSPSIFFRKLLSSSKEMDLLGSIERYSRGEIDSSTFLVHTDTFDKIHNSPFAYWVSSSTLSLLRTFLPIEGNVASVRVGLQTGNDTRFLRMTWEVPPETIGTVMSESPIPQEDFRAKLHSAFRNGKRWAFYSKTDYACPWLSPLTFVVDWQDDGDRLKDSIRARGHSPSKEVRSEDRYFDPGFSYMVRSTRLVPYVVPPGVIPMAVRSQVYPNPTRETDVLGICASRIGSAIARFGGGAFARPMFQASMVQNISTLPITQQTEQRLNDVFSGAMQSTRTLLSQFEPWQEFERPAFLIGAEAQKVTWDLSTLVGHDVEDLITLDTGLSREECTALCRDLDEAILLRTQKGDMAEGASDVDDVDSDDDDGAQKILDFSSRAIADGCVSYLVGVVFGRWDIRFVEHPELLRRRNNVLDTLPAVPPASLIGVDGLPASSNNIASEEWLGARSSASSVPDLAKLQRPSISKDEYAFDVQWTGIVADDSSRHEDVVNLSLQALERVNQIAGRSQGETWLCNTLGVNTLRDYFRKPGKGGFWDDHVTRYKAKRGRKAPIYWLLQSSKKNYAIWLYYHRLDKDTLFKVLVNYVQPKVRMETARIESIRSQVVSGGSGKESKRIAKDLERQDDFLSELRDFEEKLRRAADLHLEPDLNDGVLLNIASLHELVPWSEAGRYWKELLEGKYEWSSIGKQLRQKGLVK